MREDVNAGMSEQEVSALLAGARPQPEKTHTLRLVTEMTAQIYGPPSEETWAIAMLDDGTEIRVRHLGDRLEVRGWDPKGQCEPPALRAEVLGLRHHIVDVRSSSVVEVPDESP